MHLRIYKTPAKKLRDKYTWKEIANVVQKASPTEIKKVDTLSWQAPVDTEDAHFLVWSGPFVQERSGALRVEISGVHTAVLLNGRLELPVSAGDQSVDFFVPRGVHDLTIFTVASPKVKSVGAKRARENQRASSITTRPFVAADFNTSAVPDIKKFTPPPPAKIIKEENRWTLKMPSLALRFINFEFLEYRGEAIAISNVEISGGGKKHIPPTADVLELANNNTLELAPGDTVKASYLDELTAGAEQRNRLLTRSLTATYYNGEITPISYDFSRDGKGSIKGSRKELLRIEPGERIVAEVVDFDLDTSLERDTVKIEVQVSANPPITFTAIETDASSGVFLAEIDTAAEPTEGKIVVKQGDKVYLGYIDRQNTFPGHSYHRETAVLLNEPTKAHIQIVDSAKTSDSAPELIPVERPRPSDYVSKIEYRLPLTVEVIDPDRAMDSKSTVLVDVITSQGAKVQVECVLSRAFASSNENLSEARNPALLEGRFVGQIPLLLGDTNSAPMVPEDGSLPKTGLGKVILPAEDNPKASLDDGSDKSNTTLAVLSIAGSDTFTASYNDEARPDGSNTAVKASAALFSAATPAITGSE